MLYKEIIAVCSQIHTKHINTLCGMQNIQYTQHQHSIHTVPDDITTCLYSERKQIRHAQISLSFG